MGNKRAMQTHKILTPPLAGHKCAFMRRTSAGGLSEHYTSARQHQFDKSTENMKIVFPQNVKHVKEKKEKVSEGVKLRHTSRNPDNEKRLSGMTEHGFYSFPLFHFEVYHMQICLIIDFTLSNPRIYLLEAQHSFFSCFVA